MPVYPNMRWRNKEDAILIFLANLMGFVHFWFMKFISKTLKSGREIVYVNKEELDNSKVIPKSHFKKMKAF